MFELGIFKTSLGTRPEIDCNSNICCIVNKVSLLKNSVYFVSLEMPDDLCYPVSFDNDDDLGFFSIFDGYDEGSHELEKKRFLIDSSDDEDEELQKDEGEELDSSDEEMELKKKWKASTKTTMDKYERISLSLKLRLGIRLGVPIYSHDWIMHVYLP